MKLIKNKKPNIGIDIDEIFRAKWLQFDRFYAQEFGEEGIPENDPYVFDFFKNYKWEDTIETIQELKDAEDMPDDINPRFYQVDEETGEVPADNFIMKKKEENFITAIEQYNRFMYQDYLFEIFGSAPLMYRGMDLHVNEFLAKYDDYAKFTVMSIENKFSIPPTLFFLSKMTSRFDNYRFVEDANEMWKGIDILITTNPDLLKKGAPWGKKIIKVRRPYNENIQCSFNILQLNELTTNKKFEKIINYKKK